MAGTSRWIPLGQVFPWRAGAENPEDAVKDIARFNRRSPLSSRPTARRRKIRGNPFPLFVCNTHNAIETKVLPWRQLKNKVFGIASSYCCRMRHPQLERIKHSLFGVCPLIHYRKTACTFSMGTEVKRKNKGQFVSICIFYRISAIP